MPNHYVEMSFIITCNWRGATPPYLILRKLSPYKARKLRRLPRNTQNLSASFFFPRRYLFVFARPADPRLDDDGQGGAGRYRPQEHQVKPHLDENDGLNAGGPPELPFYTDDLPDRIGASCCFLRGGASRFGEPEDVDRRRKFGVRGYWFFRRAGEVRGYLAWNDRSLRETGTPERKWS